MCVAQYITQCRSWYALCACYQVNGCLLNSNTNIKTGRLKTCILIINRVITIISVNWFVPLQMYSYHTKAKPLILLTILYYLVNFPIMVSEVMHWICLKVAYQDALNMLPITEYHHNISPFHAVFLKAQSLVHCFSLFISMICVHCASILHLYYLQMIQTCFVMVLISKKWQNALMMNLHKYHNG